METVDNFINNLLGSITVERFYDFLNGYLLLQIFYLKGGFFYGAANKKVD